MIFRSSTRTNVPARLILVRWLPTPTIESRHRQKLRSRRGPGPRVASGGPVEEGLFIHPFRRTASVSQKVEQDESEGMRIPITIMVKSLDGPLSSNHERNTSSFDRKNKLYESLRKYILRIKRSVSVLFL